MHDSVADGLDTFHPAHRVGELSRVEMPLGDLELAVGKHPVALIRVHQADLQRARAGVEDEYPQVALTSRPPQREGEQRRLPRR